MYDFRTTEVSDLLLLDENKNLDWIAQRSIFRSKIADAIFFASIKFKLWYDRKHRFIIINERNYVFLRLHRDYHLSSESSRKLSQQVCDSFLIKKRVNKLTYELQLFNHWRIHSMISIAQTKSALTSESNSFNRLYVKHSSSVQTNENTEDWAFYEIEKLIDRRFRKYDRDSLIKEYLVRWKEYDAEFDEWYKKNLLKDSSDLMLNYDLNNSLSTSRETRKRWYFSTRASSFWKERKIVTNERDARIIVRSTI